MLSTVRARVPEPEELLSKGWSKDFSVGPDTARKVELGGWPNACFVLEPGLDKIIGEASPVGQVSGDEDRIKTKKHIFKTQFL